MSTGEHDRRPTSGEYFDTRVASYDSTYDQASGYALRSRMLAAIQLVGDGPGEVLDAGMGAGRLVAELVERDWTVTGIDASLEMVTAARRRLPRIADRLLQGQIESLPFEDVSFDVVIATGVLEYADLEQAVSELNRVLRLGGRVVASYPNPGNPYWLWRTLVWYPLVGAAKWLLRQPPLTFPRPSPKLASAEFRALLYAAGLQPEDTIYTSFLVVPSPFDKLLPRASELVGLHLERTSRRFGRRLASQVVYAARKPVAAEDLAE